MDLYTVRNEKEFTEELIKLLRDAEILAEDEVGDLNAILDVIVVLIDTCRGT